MVQRDELTFQINCQSENNKKLYTKRSRNCGKLNSICQCILIHSLEWIALNRSNQNKPCFEKTK